MKSEVELALSETAATGAGTGVDTVNVEAPVCPSTVATIAAEPALTAVTAPDAETVATAALVLDHVIGLPESTLPAASRTIAVAAVV